MSQCWHVIPLIPDHKWDLKPNLNILFCLCFVTCERDGRDTLEGLCFLICTKLKLDMFDVCVCVCVCVLQHIKSFKPNFFSVETSLRMSSCRPQCAHREPGNELTMWLLIGVYLDSVFRAAYRHGSSAGLCLRSGVCGGAVWKAVPFGARLASRTSAYQWVGLRRHGSSRRHRSFSRPNPPSLHGPISKSCS